MRRMAGHQLFAYKKTITCIRTLKCVLDNLFRSYFFFLQIRFEREEGKEGCPCNKV